MREKMMRGRTTDDHRCLHPPLLTAVGHTRPGDGCLGPLFQAVVALALSHARSGLSLPGSACVSPLVLSPLHALRLCFLLTLFVRPDRFYRLPDSLRTLPLSRYLAALVSTRLIMLTFLFRLRFSRSRCLSLLSLPLDTYTRESSLQILTQTRLLLTKYCTKLLSAVYQVADTSPYCLINRSLCTCIIICR